MLHVNYIPIKTLFSGGDKKAAKAEDTGVAGLTNRSQSWSAVSFEKIHEIL